METQLNLRILNVKDLNRFVVKEEETPNAQRYKKLEKLMQKTYNSVDEHKFGNFKVGSYVVVHINPFPGKSAKLWLRAVIRKIYDVESLLYSVYLVDCGIEKCLHKSSLRELKPHFGHDFVPFQAFDFFLVGIEAKKEINKIEVIKYIESLFETKNNLVFATIERKDRFGSFFGHILIEKDCDLASVLIEKHLVNDISCGNSRKNGFKMNSNAGIPQTSKHNSFSPRLQTSRATTHKETNNCVHNYGPNCKCEAIIQYRRKKLRDFLKNLKEKELLDKMKTNFEESNGRKNSSGDQEKRETKREMNEFVELTPAGSQTNANKSLTLK
jgi:hypothetical protein